MCHKKLSVNFMPASIHPKKQSFWRSYLRKFFGFSAKFQAENAIVGHFRQFQAILGHFQAKFSANFFLQKKPSLPHHSFFPCMVLYYISYIYYIYCKLKIICFWRLFVQSSIRRPLSLASPHSCLDPPEGSKRSPRLQFMLRLCSPRLSPTLL